MEVKVMIYFKTILFFLLFSFSFAKAQSLLLEENFNFTGNLSANGWSAHSGAGSSSPATTTGLSYSGYPSSGIGNAATIVGGSGSREDVNQGFFEENVNGASVFLSFLVEVNSFSTTADYFIHLGNRTSPTSFSNFCARVFVKNVSGSIRFGISNNSAETMGTTDFNINVTYLVIVKYTINTSGNDKCSLWVLSSGVPSSEVNAGTPEVTNLSTAGQDAIDAIGLRQGSLSYDVIIDGIRIADDWSVAPLPVELASFSASITDDGIKLDWQTETEVNNYGFKIERQIGSQQSSADNWEEIGFMEGYGNSNSPKEYSFIDINISGGKYSYRLKQIDNDGTFTYSNVVNIDANTLLQYALEQNYPNPFNPSTQIKFTLPEAAQVTVKIFNVLGQEVAVLVNKRMEGGTHEVNFDATGLNSGIYLYRIESGNFFSVKKMTMLR